MYFFAKHIKWVIIYMRFKKVIMAYCADFKPTLDR